jgi:beta-glucosidase/6-phospho-beta-glucosidase/beta-galactosidase
MNMDKIGMNIDVTQNMPINLSENSAKKAAQANQQNKKDNSLSVDPQLRAQYSKYIDQALKIQNAQNPAIAQAVEDINAGLIDTPQNAEKAAEFILKSGL